MTIRDLTRTVAKGFYSVTEVSVWIGYIALAGIVAVTFVGAAGRYLFGRPLRGGYEIVLLAMTVLVGFAIMYTTVKQGHVAIDLVIGRFPRRTQIVIQSIYSLLSAGTWAALAYRVCLHVLNALEGSERSDTLHLPMAPFLLTLAVATFLCCLVLLIQTFHPAVSEKQPGENEV